MSDQAARFFEDLGRQRHVRLLEGTTGTVLLEITDGKEAERRYVAIKRGDVSVSGKGPDPDCTIRTDAETFRAIVGGQMNAIAAVLRGKVEVDGRVSLLVALQSLFLPSPGAADQPAAGYAGRPT
jgi:putative sterol carrier protein